MPISAGLCEDKDPVELLLSASRVFQDVAENLIFTDEHGESPAVGYKAFLLDLKARCFWLHDLLNRVKGTILRNGCELTYRIMSQFETVVTSPQTSAAERMGEDQPVGEVLYAFTRLWDNTSNTACKREKLQLARRWIGFPVTSEERREFNQAIYDFAYELMAHYAGDYNTPEESTMANTRQSEPPSTVWEAVQTVFTTLVCVAEARCRCDSAHDFGARIRLGTYRKPRISPDGDLGINFDAFLSMNQNWQETRINSPGGEKQSSVRFEIDHQEQATPTRPRPPKSIPNESQVKKLCFQLHSISKKQARRLELKVTGGKLFQLRSTASLFNIDKTKDAISLAQIFRERSEAMSPRVRLILGVFLGSAVLHLHDTPWLEPDWDSSKILFPRTRCSSVPLVPFIQTSLLAKQAQTALGQQETSELLDNTRSEISDDFDLDDIIQHQFPVLISLAVVLMELYEAKPFEILARRYKVYVGGVSNESLGSRYLDVCEVFKRWKQDIPSYTQFPLAVDKCLNLNLWQDENGVRLEGPTLRKKMYEEVVSRLETEWIHAFSQSSIDELDANAAEMDFWNWGQKMPEQYLREEPNISTEILSSTPILRKRPSPQDAHSHATSTQLIGSQISTASGQHDKEDSIFAGNITQMPVLSNMSAEATKDDKLMKFFDDEVSGRDGRDEKYVKDLPDLTSASSLIPSRSNGYKDWKKRYTQVYDKFIPEKPTSRLVRVAVLDTGLDVIHPDVEARNHQIKAKLNWLHGNAKSKNKVPDRDGHGTFTACLVLDYARDAELYVAKIADKEPTSPETIAKAIDYAVTIWKVDIISMSFGWPQKNINGYDKLEKALGRARQDSVLLFAAASNDGAIRGLSFPARDDSVIAVHSTDTLGNPSKFTPTAKTFELNLATVGENIESAWPVVQCNEEINECCVARKSGTSYATPIMAGIAAFLLQYARESFPENAANLKKQKVMREVLKRISEKSPHQQPRGGYHFVDLSLHTDNLFGKDKALIDATLIDILVHT
ncbi:pfs domain-containing protein [Colletotrichum simmondsii]|uniref:Pfs domain-containing protein n=1 Tax=Colletotrichum simmondsii TaxID=703756 RepID=A0A135SE57_9PEZI|nr:pfs domain-containing protein [Colletotrichum simmondsii]